MKNDPKDLKAHWECSYLDLSVHWGSKELIEVLKGEQIEKLAPRSQKASLWLTGPNFQKRELYSLLLSLMHAICV